MEEAKDVIRKNIDLESLPHWLKILEYKTDCEFILQVNFAQNERLKHD